MLDKKVLKKELELYRRKGDINYRLKGYPFETKPCVELFGINNIPAKNLTNKMVKPIFPCLIFGRYLILKIIDELLE